MKRKEVEKFVSSYANAVLKMECNNIAAHFHDRFMLSTQANTWFISNDEEFQTNLAKSFEGYKQLGAQVCKKMAHQIVEFQSNHCLAHIEWALLDDQSIVLVSFSISYCIKKLEKDLKIIFVVAHNERERIEAHIKKREA